MKRQPTKTMTAETGGDLVLQEIRRSKDELPAAHGHDIHRLFADRANGCCGDDMIIEARKK